NLPLPSGPADWDFYLASVYKSEYRRFRFQIIFCFLKGQISESIGIEPLLNIFILR
ncbi:unnamed protein product, partial [Larinioides sclopetarius]